MNNTDDFFFLKKKKTKKKLKQTLTDTDSDNETEACFPRFIIIESTEIPITNLSPFVIEKLISSNIKPITVKKNNNFRTKPC